MDGYKKGCLELIVGPMFSGKTEELLRRLRRVVIAKKKVQIFKPHIDNRYSANEVVTNDQLAKMPASIVKTSREILALLEPDTMTVAVDEGQFFDTELPAVCEEMADRGLRVIVTGLDTDFMNRPFGTIPILLAVADDVTKLKAICCRCGLERATKSYRSAANRDVHFVGGTDAYQALCRPCFRELMKPEPEISSN